MLEEQILHIPYCSFGLQVLFRLMVSEFSVEYIDIHEYFQISAENHFAYIH